MSTLYALLRAVIGVFGVVVEDFERDVRWLVAGDVHVGGLACLAVEPVDVVGCDAWILVCVEDVFDGESLYLRQGRFFCSFVDLLDG